MPMLASILDVRARGPVGRWTVPIFVIGAAVALRGAIAPVLPPGYPFLTFFPAVILATFVAGRMPGVLAAVLGGLASLYWFIPPYGSWKGDAPALFALSFYFFVALFDVVLIGALQERQRQLVTSERAQAALSEHQVLLFKELQHRVANNLASISAMLRLQRRQIERHPERAGEILASADARIERMGQIHRLLYDPAARETPSVDHIAQTVAQIADVAGAEAIAISVEGDRSIRLETGRMLTLALLVGELVTNSLKHGYDPGEGGRIDVELVREGPSGLLLRVADDGRGLAAGDSPPPSRSGLGSAIIAGLVRQLNARIERDGSAGMRCEVRFPED